MKLSSKMVGTRIRPFHYSVSFRDVSNFAASIGDDNDGYFDTEKTPAAHPLFPVRISWQIIQNLVQLWDADIHEDLLAGMVHHSEHIQIHRDFHPGDDLTVKGECVALVPHHLGAKIVLRFDYTDVEYRLVVTEYTGAIVFGVNCSDEGKILPGIPEIQRVGECAPIWKEEIEISRLAPYIYDGCNDIVYPIHTDRRFARSIGLPDIVLQGTATLAMGVSALVRKEGCNLPKNVKMVAARFTDIVVPPNKLVVRLLKKRGADFYFDVMEQSGKTVIKGGYMNIGSNSNY